MPGKRWEFDLQAYTGTLHYEFDMIIGIRQTDPVIEKLYYDLLVPLQSFNRMEKDDLNRIEIEQMTLGAVLMLAALSLFVYNRWEADQAECASNDVMAQMGDEKTDYELVDSVSKFANYIQPKDGIMPTKTVDGYEYIGTIEIPRFGIKLSVMNEWSYPGLRISPGRFSGSVWTKNLVICAHNYERHFGNLRDLETGDTVIFTDVLNNVFEYTVIETDTLKPDEVQKMTTGDWDLTLFTCTFGGASRVTVRCMLTDESGFEF